MRRSSISIHLLACVVTLLIATSATFSHALWTPDEPVGAAVGRNMLRTGDWVMPQLGGAPFLEKPPLYWWVQAAGYSMFGFADWVARLPSVLFMALTLGLVYVAALRVGGARVGWVALGVLGSIVQFSEDMGRVVVDPALVFFVAVAWLAFAVWAGIEASPSRRRLAAAVVGVATALAFLSKGWVGCGLALGAPALYFVLRDRTRALVPLLALAPWVVAALAVFGLPWVLALERDGGMAAVRECLLGNTLGRAFGTAKIESYGHRQPFWYYALDGVVASLPWVLALPAAWRASSSASARRLFLGAAAVGVALLSLAASKRTLYLVPLYPGVAIAVAAWIATPRDWRAPGERLHRVTARLLIAFACATPFLLAVLAATLGFLPLGSSTYAPLLTAIRRAPAGPVLAAVATAAMVLGVACVRRARRAWRLEQPLLPAGLLVVPPLLLLMAAQSVLKWAIDPVKTLHDTTRALAAASPGDGPVALYRPGTREEKIAAIVDFDLGRRLELLHDEGEVAEYFTRFPRGAMLVASTVLEGLPPGVRMATRSVYDERGRKATPYAVLVAASNAIGER